MKPALGGHGRSPEFDKVSKALRGLEDHWMDGLLRASGFRNGSSGLDGSV